ncbi:MAG: hypothetical protein JNJ41_11775 [Bacteroidia bacterium]|nr:hypothetical protein [Bacteroidia bacterium]
MSDATDGIADVLDYALQQIIQSSSESVPNVGRNKESQIVVLDSEGLQSVGSILNDYVINRKFMKNGQPILYGNIHLY